MTDKNKYTYLFLGFVLFFFAFLISRVQFFACPTVEIQSDSGEYMYWIDFYLKKGEWPPINFIPIGYPLIIKAITIIRDSVYPIVYFQFALTFASFFFLLLIIWRFYDKKIYLISLFLICLYVQVPNNFYWDIYLMSESVYNSSLIILFASLVGFFNKRDRRFACILSFSLAFPILFRPTGIFTVVFILLLILYLLYTKQKALVRFITIPFLSVYALLSTYSFFVSGDANFIGLRVKNETTTDMKYLTDLSDPKSLAIVQAIERMTYNEKAFIVFKNYTTQSQVYTRIEEANSKYVVRNFAHTKEFGCTLNLDSTKVEERRVVFKEFFDNEFVKQLIEKEKQVKKQHWFKLYDIFVIYVIKKIFLNPIWVVLLLVSFIYSLTVAIASKLTNSKAMLLLFITMITLGSYSLVIIGRHLPYPRYSYPSEFIFLLQLPFLYDLLREKINAFK